jgi:hypothetical protein
MASIAAHTAGSLSHTPTHNGLFSDTGGKLSPVSTTPAANFATSSPCVVDTGDKFATVVNDTGGKFAACVNVAGGKLPPVSTTPAANNGNNTRLQTPESELEGKNLNISFLYHPKVTKQND